MPVIHSSLLTGERSFTYNGYIGQSGPCIKNKYYKTMSQTQYLKMLEREIQKINKRIDLKILKGQVYAKEAREHKLLLKKVHFHARKGFINRLVDLFFRKDILRGNSYA